MLSNKELSENPIFICGHRKTGTTLMACLLDSHPELSVIPTDSGFFYAYYPLCEQMDWNSSDKQLRLINYSIRPTKDMLVKECRVNEGIAKNKMHTMESAFNYFCFYGGEDISTKEYLINLAMAYRNGISSSHSRHKYWVEKTTSSEIYVNDIKRWFPKAKFIHVVRDPRDNWASLKSGWGKKYNKHNDDIRRLMQSHLERGVLGMRLAMENEDKYFCNYLVIKYEDLVNDTESQMRLIANKFHIDYDNCLLKPTVFGYDWKGNNFDKEWNGISEKSVGRWKKELNDEEVDLIEYYYWDCMDHFDYNTVNYCGRPNMYDAVRNQYAWHNFAQIYSVDKEKYNE